MDEKRIIREWMLWKERQTDREYQQKELAVDSKTDPSYISRVMSGDIDIGKKVLKRIAAAFGVTLSQFLAGPDSLENKSEPIAEPEHHKFEAKTEDAMGVNTLFGQLVRIEAELDVDGLRMMIRVAEAQHAEQVSKINIRSISQA